MEDKKEPVKVGFVHELPFPDMYWWDDGLKKALEELAKSYEVASVPIQNIDYLFNEVRPPVILAWGGFTSKPAQLVQQFLPDENVKKAILFGGGAREIKGNWDLVFAEFKADYEKFTKEGQRTRLAFGTNTDLFKIRDHLSKKIDVLFPASFAAWKRQDLFAGVAKKMPDKIFMAVGPFQEENHQEQWCREVCEEAGVITLPTVPYRVVARLYNHSRVVLITSNWYGGSQRAVLEALASGVEPIVMSDAEMAVEMVERTGFGRVVDPEEDEVAEEVKSALGADFEPQKAREAVLDGFSHLDYARVLKEGVDELIEELKEEGGENLGES